MDIIPVNNRILLKKVIKENKIISGIIIPESENDKPDQGIILKLNDEKNIILKSKFKIGDCVLFNKYSGQNIKAGDEDLILIKEEDILAIVKK